MRNISGLQILEAHESRSSRNGGTQLLVIKLKRINATDSYKLMRNVWSLSIFVFALRVCKGNSSVFNVTNRQIDRFAAIKNENEDLKYGVNLLGEHPDASFLSLKNNYLHSEWVQDVKLRTSGELQFRIIWQFAEQKSLVDRLEDAVAVGEEVQYTVLDGDAADSTVIGTYEGVWRYASGAFEPGTLYAAVNGKINSACCLPQGAWGAADGEVDGTESPPANFWGVGSFRGSDCDGNCPALLFRDGKHLAIDLSSRHLRGLPGGNEMVETLLFVVHDGDDEENSGSKTGIDDDSPSISSDKNSSNEGTNSGIGISIILLPVIFGALCCGCVLRYGCHKRKAGLPAETVACYAGSGDDYDRSVVASELPVASTLCDEAGSNNTLPVVSETEKPQLHELPVAAPVIEDRSFSIVHPF